MILILNNSFLYIKYKNLIKIHVKVYSLLKAPCSISQYMFISIYRQEKYYFICFRHLSFVVVVIVCQSTTYYNAITYITSDVVSYNHDHGEVFSIHYVIQFIGDLRKVVVFPGCYNVCYFIIPLALFLVTVNAMCALYVLLICFVYDFRMQDTCNVYV